MIEAVISELVVVEDSEREVEDETGGKECLDGHSMWTNQNRL